MHLRHSVVAAALAVVGGFGIHTATAQTAAPGAALAKIGHIVVIFEENRSFDNMFGNFPGANGIANVGDTAIQVAPDGNPYKTCPAAIDPNLKPPAEDKRFPANLANQPFLINPF